jgi:hypothetical protein
MLVICYLFCVCVCRLKAQQSICLYVVLTMPTLNKTYLLFIYLLLLECVTAMCELSIIEVEKICIITCNKMEDFDMWLKR